MRNLVVLVVLVVTTASCDSCCDCVELQPFPPAPPSAVLPAPFLNDEIVIPANGSLLLLGAVGLTDVVAVVDETRTPLTTEVFHDRGDDWVVDVSALPVDVPTPIEVHQVDPFFPEVATGRVTSTYVVRRTDDVDVEFPTLHFAVDDTFARSPPFEPPPQAAEPDGAPAGDVCTWRIRLQVEEARDAQRPCYVEILQVHDDGSDEVLVRRAAPVFDHELTYEGSIPSGALCFAARATDVAGNETRAETICVVTSEASTCE